MTAAVKKKSELNQSVEREIDDYELDSYEFSIYAQITRRSGNIKAWESITNRACACCMSLNRTRLALQILNLVEITQ